MKDKVNTMQSDCTLDDVQSMISQIGTARRQLAKLNLEMNEQVAQINKAYAKQIHDINACIDELSAKVQVWCEANRHHLLPSGTKTAKLMTGEVSWRHRPPSVEIDKPSDTIAELERLGFGHCVRLKKEVDKKAILAHPSIAHAIGGIRICQGKEDFIISPI